MNNENETHHAGNREEAGLNPVPNSEVGNLNSKRYLFDNPRNVKILLRSFFSSLLVLLVIELFLHKHPHFAWEGWPEFYAIFGFVACVALVLAAKYILRPLVKRREDYYD